MDKHRILYLIGSLGIGGAERHLIRLAGGIDRRRFDPLVVCLNAPGIRAYEVRALNVPLFALEKKSGLEWGLLQRLKDLIVREKADLVHTHSISASYWGRAAAPLAGCPVVITEHSPRFREKLHMRLIHRMLAPVTSHAIAVSSEVGEELARNGLPREKISVILNGIALNGLPDRGERENLRRTLGLPLDRPIVGWTSRLDPHKDPMTFVRAAEIVARKNRKALFVLIGEGPERLRVDAWLREKKLHTHVSLFGERLYPEKIFPAFDLFVLSSWREGLSYVLLETMSQKIPVVATAIGGNGEIIEDGVNGFLVPPQNPEVLAEKLILLLEDAALRIRMGECARRTMEERFQEGPMVTAIEKVYEKVLPACPPKRGQSPWKGTGSEGACPLFYRSSRSKRAKRSLSPFRGTG